jgi:hypothetical protein
MPKREIDVIAGEIRQTWKKVNYAAVPYLEAMLSIKSVQDDYLFTSGKTVVIKFLGNAGTWRGEDAKRLKAELRSHL